MQNYSGAQFAYEAENNNSASCGMSAAPLYIPEVLTAIITMMAVVLYLSVVGHLASVILISIICGVIILIVRGKYQPVSRTR